MNVTIRWMLNGVVQNGYVAGAVSEIVESSPAVQTQEEIDLARVMELKGKGNLTDAEKDEALMLLLKMVP